MKLLPTVATMLLCAALPTAGTAAGGGAGGARATRNQVKFVPYVKDPKGFNQVSAGFISYRKRLVLAAGKSSAASDPAVCGGKVVGINPNYTGEDFYLQFDISPKAVAGENCPFWEVSATVWTDPSVTGKPSEMVQPRQDYIRRFYLPIGHHAVPDPTRSYSIPAHAKTADGWDTYAYNHHGCFDENDQGKTSIGHPDHVNSVTFVYNQPATQGSTNYAMIDNVILTQNGAPLKEAAN